MYSGQWLQNRMCLFCTKGIARIRVAESAAVLTMSLLQGMVVERPVCAGNTRENQLGATASVRARDNLPPCVNMAVLGVVFSGSLHGLRLHKLSSSRAHRRVASTLSYW